MEPEIKTTELKSWVVPVVISVVAVTGAIAGYIFWRRRKNVVILEQRVRTIRIVEDEGYGDPSNVVQFSEFTTEEPQELARPKLVEDIPGLNRATNPKVDYSGISRVNPPISELAWQNPPTLDEEVIEEVAPVENVFAANRAEWDYELELSRRDPHKPYIIHADEFVAGEKEFRQVSLTYYESDNTMIDPFDTIVYDYHKLTGDLEFGHGSGEEDVVYIRNEAEEIEYEVLRHKGMYSIEVLGQRMEDEADNELRHSHAVPRMRRE